MSATLDGQELFGEQWLEIELGSLHRDSMERTVPGLDGVVSIDLGSRSRKIKQKGVLRAASRVQMDEKINAISVYMDGDTHTLVTGSGESIGNLRMDAFKVMKEQTGGGCLCRDYEIIYTQLVV
jgi:hypothetical protein